MTETTTHECPAKDCALVVPFEILACKEHWFDLPVPLRKAISKAWRTGNLFQWESLRAEAVDLLEHPETFEVSVRE